MDAPPEHEAIDAFVRTARRFLDIGLNVPEVLAIDEAQGFVLMTDLGRTTYLDRLREDTVERLYRDALGALAVLQAGTSTDPGFFPPYDRALLLSEMELFRAWYVRRHLERTLSAAEQATVSAAFALLCDSALEQPMVWVHRDYHSRNLMLVARNNPGILDFQDAVTGPVTYDLVSLLRDCYIKWPPERVRGWVRGYRSLALQHGLPVGDDDARFMRWFDLMGVQRHIKVLGIFARLWHRDGKPAYLGDLPRVWEYLVQVCRDYPELHALRSLLMDLPPPCTR